MYIFVRDVDLCTLQKLWFPPVTAFRTIQGFDPWLLKVKPLYMAMEGFDCLPDSYRLTACFLETSAQHPRRDLQGCDGERFKDNNSTPYRPGDN